MGQLRQWLAVRAREAVAAPGGTWAGELARGVLDGREWWRNRRHHSRGYRLRDRARIQYGFARNRAVVRWPVHGSVLDMLQNGSLEVGDGVLVASNVEITCTPPGRVVLKPGAFLNIGVHVAAVDLVEIGANTLVGPGCFIADSDHRFEQIDRTLWEQGFTSKGPTLIGDNVWLGANVFVGSGVTIGERCVVGANSVVTRDLPAYTVAVGAPAKAIKTFGPAAPRDGAT